MNFIFDWLLAIYPYMAFLALLLFAFFTVTAVQENGLRLALPAIRNNTLAAVAVAVVMPSLLAFQTDLAVGIETSDTSSLGGDILIYLRWPLLALAVLSFAATLVFSRTTK